MIGRDKDCDITLDLKEISRRHATVQAIPVGVSVTDLGSANGTFVNGERIVSNQPHSVHAGDEIAFDKERFRLEPIPGAVRMAPTATASASASAGRTGTGRWISLAVIVVIIALVIAWFATR